MASSRCSAPASASSATTPRVVWGFPIANYVWWIGIGNAGTLISSLLLLTRQTWRTSINRFAEAMTLFAVSIAGLFPIFHLGRPLYFYWLAPYPDTMTGLAAVAQRAGLGFLGDHELPPVLDHLLVRRRRARSRHVPAIARGARGGRSTASSRSAGAARRAIGATTADCRSRSPRSRRRSSAPSIRSSGSISRRA